MSLPMLPRRRARQREEPKLVLPAPGPYPAAQPPRQAIVIFVIVIVTVVWLLAHGYSTDSALGITAGAGAITAGIRSCLAGTPPADAG